MTERQLRDIKAAGVDLDKVRQGCENLFKYLDENEFSLMETKYLISSMGLIVEDIVKIDPLRKIAEFNYSSSVGNAFSCSAASNTTS